MPLYGLPFFFQVSLLGHRDDPTESLSLPGARWQPPSDHHRFDIKDSTGWHIWDPGRMSNVAKLRRLRRPEPEEEVRLQKYRAATIFWEPYLSNYLHIPIDCTVTDLAKSDSAWRHPGFSICQFAGHEDVAVIGHSEAHNQLHLPGPPSWFEKLLPLTFQPPGGYPFTVTQHICKLVGDLDILIAMIAFSTTFDNALDAIDRLFRPEPRTTTFEPNWSHHLPIDDRKSRSCVIKLSDRTDTSCRTPA